MASAVSPELSRGVLHASDLRERLGVSPATLMRVVRSAGPDVIRIGRGRATRYALRQSWPNLDSSRFPLCRITEAGAPVSAGELITLAARQSVWMPAGAVSDGLPIELVDARPSLDSWGDISPRFTRISGCRRDWPTGLITTS